MLTEKKMERLEELRAKRQWTLEEAQEVLEAWRKSKETIANFSQRHGLKPGRIFFLRARLEKASPGEPSKLDKNASAIFAPMTIRLPEQAPLIIARVNKNGVQIKLSSNTTSAIWMATLIQALEGGT
jgi:NTP pyrophosphatase (non-canonical NTP hydrolase)